RVLANRLAAIERVEDPCRLGVEADVPAPAFVLDRTLWLDPDLYVQEMPDEGLDHPGEGIESRLGKAKVHRRVEAIGAVPVERLVVLRQYIERDLTHRRAGLCEQGAEAAEPAGFDIGLHDLGIGQHQPTLPRCRRLLAEED